MWSKEKKLLESKLADSLKGKVIYNMEGGRKTTWGATYKAEIIYNKTPPRKIKIARTTKKVFLPILITGKIVNNMTGKNNQAPKCINMAIVYKIIPLSFLPLYKLYHANKEMYAAVGKRKPLRIIINGTTNKKQRNIIKRVFLDQFFAFSVVKISLNK